MNTVVWKFPLAGSVGRVRAAVAMPAGAQILSVGVIEREPFVWALVDPTEPRVQAVGLVLLETGQPAIGALGPFLGRVDLFDGRYVLHIFKEHA